MQIKHTMSNTKDNTTPTNTNTIENATTSTITDISITQIEAHVPKSSTPPISPPEITTTITNTNNSNTNNANTNDTTTTTTTSSYAPVTGQSQTVSTSRFNPIKPPSTPTTVTVIESKTVPAPESKQDDTLIQQQLLNQYAFYNTPNASLNTVTNPLAALVGNSVHNINNNNAAALLASSGGLGVGVGGGLLSGGGVGNAAAQQYLLYNQLAAAQATAQQYNNINNSALLNPLLRAQLMAQRAAQLQSMNSNSQKWVLFVFHLPEDMDDSGLLLLFSPFGATQAIVMRHKNTDCSRGFGFVHFRTKNDAQIAIDMMNGYQIGHKRLRVSFKKSKE